MDEGLINLNARLASLHALIESSTSDPLTSPSQASAVSVSVCRGMLIKLASAGFGYSKEKGIQCDYCQCTFNEWDWESPLGVHRVLSPNCPFLNSSSSSNGIKLFDNPSKYSEPMDSMPWNQDCGVAHQNGNGVNTSTSRQFDRTNDISENQNEGFDWKKLSLRWLLDHSEEYTGKIVHPKLGNPQEMCREALRLLTFPNPTNTKAEEWARNGFIFIENNDCVQCVYCLQCSSFDEKSAVETHKRMSPTCAMVSGIDMGDISTDFERKVFEKIRKIGSTMDANITQKQPYSVLHHGFSSVEKRLQSFQSWSPQLKPTKHQLSDAGFFYTGVGTKVISFCCGLNLRDWEQTADAWSQHANLSPDCGFVIVEKGDRFIQDSKNIEKKVEVDQRVTDPVCKMEELNVPDPFPATLNPELLTALSTCGYSRQQLFKCVVKFFHITCGRYPNIPMLMAAVLADGELKQREDMLDYYRNVIERKDQVIDQMESLMEAKDQLTKATIVSINQKRDIQLQENRQQTQALERQIQIFEQQIQERGVQLRQRVQQNQALKQLIQALDEQIQIFEQQIPNLEQQIQALANEYSRLRSKGCPPLNTDSVTTCMFCLQEIKMVMFTPCKHVCCGIKCLPKFKNRHCPLCRVKIQDWKFVFIV